MERFKSTEDAMAYVEEEKKKQEANKTSYAISDVRNFRFYMKYGTEANIVFLDDLLFPAKEHQMKKIVGDKQMTYFETCIEDIEGECPPCENGVRSFLGFASTIIHLDPVGKEGKEYPPTKKLIVIKQGAAENWLRRQKEYGSLVGKVFKLYRSTDSKSPTTGSDIDFKKDVDWEKLKQYAPEGTNPDEWIQPFNYAEIFQPKSAAELRKIIGVPEPVGSGGEEPVEQDNNNNGEAKKKLADLI